MKRNGSSSLGNYLRASIIKIKIPHETNLNSFLLRMDFNNQVEETDKLTGKEIDLKKCFYFDFPFVIHEDEKKNNSKSNNSLTNFNSHLTFEISAYSKTLFFFDSLIAKLNIPLNTMNLIDRKEWFTLKNNKDENCLMILMSFADMRDKKSREISNSLFLENGNCSMISNSSIENRMKISVIVNKSKFNFSTEGKPINEDTLNYTICKCNKKNCQYCEGYKGQDSKQKPQEPNNFNLNFNRRNSASNIPIDFRSTEKSLLLLPPSHRNHRDSNNTMIQARISKPDETGYLTTLDSVLLDRDEWMGLDLNSNYINNANSQSQSETFILEEKNRNKLNGQTQQSIIEENDKLMKTKENLKIQTNRLLNYEHKIFKEKENLENNIKMFKKKQYLLEQKCSEIQQNFKKMDYELEKIRLQNNLLESTKNNFFNLNLMINSYHYLPCDTNLKNINNILSTVISINHTNIKNSKLEKIDKICLLSDTKNHKGSSKNFNIPTVENSPLLNFTKPSSPLNQLNSINLTKICPYNQISPPPQTTKMTIEKFDHSISSLNGIIQEKSIHTEKHLKDKIIPANMSKLSLSINHQHKDSKSTIINSKDSIESTLKEISNSTANSTCLPSQINSNIQLSKLPSNIVKINLNTLSKNNKRENSQGKKSVTPTLINANSNKTPASMTISVHTQSKQNLHNNLLSPSANSKIDRRTSGGMSAKPRTASEDKFVQVHKQNSIGVRVSKVKENQAAHESNLINNTLTSSNTFNNTNISSFVKSNAPVTSSKFQKTTSVAKSMSVQKSLINIRKK